MIDRDGDGVDMSYGNVTCGVPGCIMLDFCQGGRGRKDLRW